MINVFFFVSLLLFVGWWLVAVESFRSKKYGLNYRMGEEGRLEISWEDWRDYLLMSPSADFHEIVHYWRHATVNSQIHNIDDSLSLANPLFLILKS